VNLLPCPDAHRGRIEVGSLLGQLLPSLFGTLRFVRREGLSVIFTQIARAGQRHMEPNPVNERKDVELRYRLHQLSRRRRNFARGKRVTRGGKDRTHCFTQGASPTRLSTLAGPHPAGSVAARSRPRAPDAGDESLIPRPGPECPACPLHLREAQPVSRRQRHLLEHSCAAVSRADVLFSPVPFAFLLDDSSVLPRGSLALKHLPCDQRSRFRRRYRPFWPQWSVYALRTSPRPGIGRARVSAMYLITKPLAGLTRVDGRVRINE